MLRPRYLLLLALSGTAQADILEERLSNGSSLFVPSAFPLNPAGNATSLTIVNIEQTKSDDKIDFILNPGNNDAKVEEKVAKKDLAFGGQYPLGGASIGLNYSEHRREVTAKNENQNNQNKELFVNRDYRMLFGVDFTPELRGAFTFHYTALSSDLAGNFQIGDQDRTHYHGNMSGYGLGLYYQLKVLGIGAFHHPPMRGKATVEGEQKIVTEPGIYGLNFNFRAAQRTFISFNVTRWSYKHDERDDPSTSPVDQRNILLRGLDLNQYHRKTMAYGLSAEFAITPQVYAKGQYLKQEGVFLFDPDSLPGDNKDLETRVRSTELQAGVSMKVKDFVAEFGLLRSSAEAGTIKSQSGFGNIGDYESKTTGVSLMIGAAF